MQQKRVKRVIGEILPGGKTVKVDGRRERGHSVRQDRSEEKPGYVVCLQGANIEDIAEKEGQVMGGGTGGAVLVHVGTNNSEKEETSAIVGKYRSLIKTHKEARYDWTDCIVGDITNNGMQG